MKTRPWGLYIFIAVLLGLFFYGTGRLLKLRYEAGDIYPPFSSLRSDPLGTRALYEGIDRLEGFSCSRNYKPFTELTELRETTIFYQGVNAWRFLHAADKEAVEAVEEIVASGGRLFISFLPVSRTRGLTSFLSEPEAAEKDDSSESGDEEEQAAEEDGAAGEDERHTEEGEAEREDQQPAEDGEEESAESFSLVERWGLKFEVGELPETEDDDERRSSLSAQLAVSQPGSLPESLSWHTALYFSPQDEAWRVIYRRGAYPVLLERSFGKGTILLSADSYFLSNEALRDERYPHLLAWLVGEHSKVLFDETHFGVRESQGVATLIRKYRLEGFFIALLFLALLYVWKNATSLVPRQKGAAAASSVAGKDMMTGLVNLLRSNISARQLLPECFKEWKKSFAHLQKEKPELFQEISEAIRTEEKRPSRERDPVKAYRHICHILKRKR